MYFHLLHFKFLILKLECMKNIAKIRMPINMHIYIIITNLPTHITLRLFLDRIKNSSETICNKIQKTKVLTVPPVIHYFHYFQ